eukprot:1152598-Pelagomonas_calceolata.AAC.3
MEHILPCRPARKQNKGRPDLTFYHPCPHFKQTPWECKLFWQAMDAHAIPHNPIDDMEVVMQARDMTWKCASNIK